MVLITQPESSQTPGAHNQPLISCGVFQCSASRALLQSRFPPPYPSPQGDLSCLQRDILTGLMCGSSLPAFGIKWVKDSCLCGDPITSWNHSKMGTFSISQRLDNISTLCCPSLQDSKDMKDIFKNFTSKDGTLW